jgi:[ribosomal protein S18]-alanine N-acetyltransferase
MSALPTIRNMTVDDVDRVLAIEEASSVQPWTSGIFADELRDSVNRSYRVATVFPLLVPCAVANEVSVEQVVGFCGLLLQFDEGHITNIAIDPKHRRNGYGARLLLDTVQIAISQKLRALTLEVRVSNVSARLLYQRFGFAPVGVRPKYYKVGNEDALIMWAHDIDAAPYQVRIAEIAANMASRAAEDVGFRASDPSLICVPDKEATAEPHAQVGSDTLAPGLEVGVNMLAPGARRLEY